MVERWITTCPFGNGNGRGNGKTGVRKLRYNLIGYLKNNKSAALAKITLLVWLS